jgi:hypothetical protein
MQRAFGSMIVLAVVYNMLLAAANARGIHISFSIVAVVETAILACALLLVVLTPPLATDRPVFAFLYASALLALYVSLANDRISVDGLRNFLIVGVFLLVGSRCSTQTIKAAFLAVGLIVAGGLIIEIASTDTYVYLLQPAKYFANTRGINAPDFLLERGLAIGTIAYEGRFSFGVWSGSRTSSIFLEQVGINTYAIVLTIYLSVFWRKIPRWQVVFFVALYLAIILTNNARLSPIVGVVLVAGYMVFPRLPPYCQWVIPAVILLGTQIIFQFVEGRSGDDIIGRMWTTYRFLDEITLSQYLIGDPYILPSAGDTGYGYIIISVSLIGAIMYAAFVIYICPQGSKEERRLAWGTCTYIFFWLLVGGTGTFTIKTAPLLWALVGYYRGKRNEESEWFASSGVEAADSPWRRSATGRFARSQTAHPPHRKAFRGI